jgi:hypothetical protein
MMTRFTWRRFKPNVPPKRIRKKGPSSIKMMISELIKKILILSMKIGPPIISIGGSDKYRMRKAVTGPLYRRGHLRDLRISSELQTRNWMSKRTLMNLQLPRLKKKTLPKS